MRARGSAARRRSPGRRAAPLPRRRRLDELLRRWPGHSVALYNRAVLLAERHRGEAAKVAWRAFLVSEPHGPYADVARGWLGLRAPARPTPALTPALPPEAPWPRGPITPRTAAALALARQREFTIGDLRGATYEWNGWRALRFGDTLEIVERRGEI